MGTASLTLSVYGKRSAHNSAQDVLDRGTWLIFVGEVKRLAEDERFSALSLWVDATDE